MAGRFIDIVAPWYETRILNCSFCGKMIAGRYWQDNSSRDDKFCEPSCAEVKQRLKKTQARGHRHARHERHS